MREEGLRARARKRFRSTTMSEHDQPIAPNVLARQFAAERPNQRWVGDTTEFLIRSNAKLYLAAILDLYSRFIVGRAFSAVNDQHPTLRALDMAVKRRCPDSGLLHHPDQDCTYASEDYRTATRAAQRHLFDESSCNCYDDAVIESWFLAVKTSASRVTPTRRTSCSTTSKCSNQRGRHSTFGQISPAEFERRAAHAAQSNRPLDRITPTPVEGELCLRRCSVSSLSR
jgi:putative transposase